MLVTAWCCRRRDASHRPTVCPAPRHSIEHSAAASLQRLGVDAIDVYFVHGWDQDTPVDETLDALTGLVRSGHIRHVGWSNVTGWQLQRIVSTARLGGFVVPVALQPQYNLLERGSEWDLIPCCLEEQLGVTPWSPLGGGWLTGKYRRDERPSGATRLGDDPNRGVEAYDVRNRSARGESSTPFRRSPIVTAARCRTSPSPG